MPKLTTQKELREVRKLPFCYLCGNSFDASVAGARSKDHVPPESIFARSDRNPPLILPVHVSCNQQESGDDEVIGQLVALLHGKHPREERSRVQVKGYRIEGEEKPVLGLVNASLPSIIWRWVRGFHAALYREYLPEETTHVVHPPLWRFCEDGRQLRVDRPLPQEALFVERIKANRQAGAVDHITTCSSKCVYVCTWEQANRGHRFCMFALRLYDWEQLSIEGLPPRGCVGSYVPAGGMPNMGTRATRLEFSVVNTRVFDPFGS